MPDAGTDAGGSGGSGASGGSGGSGGSSDAGTDTETGSTGGSAGSGGNGSSDAGLPDSDDVGTSDSGSGDTGSSGDTGGDTPIGPQILTPVGAPTITANATTFMSNCDATEVVTGFHLYGDSWGTYGVRGICRKINPDGSLGTPRLLPQTFQGPVGGNMRAVSCPIASRPVAIGVVFNYGFETQNHINSIREIGLVCSSGYWPGAPSLAPLTVVVTLTPTPAPLDPVTSFQLNCDAPRYLTGFTGIQEPNDPIANSLARLGGQCETR